MGVEELSLFYVVSLALYFTREARWRRRFGHDVLRVPLVKVSKAFNVSYVGAWAQ